MTGRGELPSVGQPRGHVLDTRGAHRSTWGSGVALGAAHPPPWPRGSLVLSAHWAQTAPTPLPCGDPGPSPSPRGAPAPCWHVSRHPSHQTDTFQAGSLVPSHGTVVSNLILPRWSEESLRPNRGVDAAFVHTPGYLIGRDIAEGTCRGNRTGWLPRCPPWAAGPQPAWAAVLVRGRPRTPTRRRPSGGEGAFHGCLNRERPPPSLLIQVPPSDVHIYSRGLHTPPVQS